jgi:DNA gyrase subunit B
MITTSDGKGQRETLWYKDGLFQKREITKEKVGVHGTKVTYIPDPQFFQNPEANLNDIRTLFKEESALSPTLTIKLIIDGKEEDFHSKNGINDLVDEKVKDDEIIKKRFNAHIVKGNDLIDICMTYTSGYSEDIVSYVNYGKVESGIHLTTLRANLTRALNKYANDNKLYKKDETNLTGAELNEGLIIVFNLKAKSVKYDSQTKVRVTDIDKALILEAINVNFVEWMNENPKDVKTIIEKALLARRARNAAKKAREAARSKAEKKSKALKFDSKLADASEKTDRMKCEIYITEGDSASGMLKDARNKRYQAVMPIRGKMLNTQDAAVDKVIKNAEISTIMDAFFGPNGWSVVNNKIEYDMNKLRYGKIIIMSDADVDGAHIKNLFYTFIWNVCPELLIQGYVYAGRAPLYKITEKNGKSYTYLRDDTELEKYRAAHTSEKYDVGRMKGLGEMGVEETEECLTDPDRRVIDKITVRDAEAANKAFIQMMGASADYRKQFLKAYGKEAMYNAE